YDVELDGRLGGAVVHAVHDCVGHVGVGEAAGAPVQLGPLGDGRRVARSVEVGLDRPGGRRGRGRLAALDQTADVAVAPVEQQDRILGAVAAQHRDGAGEVAPLRDGDAV